MFHAHAGMQQSSDKILRMTVELNGVVIIYTGYNILFNRKNYDFSLLMIKMIYIIISPNRFIKSLSDPHQ